MSSLDEGKIRRLIQVGREIVAELDLDAVLDHVLDVACEVTGARYAALGVLDDRRQELERFITRGIDEAGRAAIGDLPRGHGVLGTLIRSPKPLRVGDVGRHPDSWGFPPAHPPMTTFLGVPIIIAGRAFGNIYLTDKEGGGEFSEADEEAMLILADWSAVAIRNAQSHQLVRRHRDDLEHAVRGLEATSELARAVGAETRLDRILELVVKRGRAMVKARLTAVLVQDGNEVEVVAAAGDYEESLVGTRLPIAESVSGEVMKTRAPVRSGDLPSRLRSGLAGMVDARSGLFVPLLFQGRALGVLNAFDKSEDGPEFNADDEAILESFAASAAVAVATAQQAASVALRRSIDATERERARWARELHDDTLQDLAALAIRLSGARDVDEPEAVRREIDKAIDQARTAAQSLRGLITELRPAALDELGLKPALESLTQRVQSTTGLEVDARLNLAYEAQRAPERLAADTEDAAYRLVQEALTNVVKHSRAERATVSVDEGESALEISVSDEGSGFSPGEDGTGFGLIGMRERVAAVGGTLEIQSEPGRGTTVRATLPIVRAGEETSGPSGSLGTMLRAAGD